MIKINENSFKEEVLDYKGLVLVDFNALWCAPCRMLTNVLEEYEKTSNIKIVSINVDDNHDLAKKYGVMSIPCVVLIKNGEEINRHVGFMNNDELNSFISE